MKIRKYLFLILSILLVFTISGNAQVDKTDFNASIGINIFSLKENRLYDTYVSQKYLPHPPSGIAVKLHKGKLSYRFALQYLKFNFDETGISEQEFGIFENDIKEKNHIKGTYQEFMPQVGIERQLFNGKKLKLSLGFDFSLGRIIDTLTLEQEFIKDGNIVEVTNPFGLGSSFEEKLYSIGVIPFLGISYQVGKRFHITYETSIIARVNSFGDNFFFFSIINPLSTHYDPISFLGVYYDLNFN